jgi:hypothetical protein
LVLLQQEVELVAGALKELREAHKLALTPDEQHRKDVYEVHDDI